MDWDDLRYVLAVYDNSSALSAAQKLGVNASTVQRRIGRFEEKNNVRLFERLQSGYRPTPQCEALVLACRDIDDSVAQLSRQILGQDVRLEGRLVVTTTDTFMNNMLARHLAAFHELHPNISVELTLTNSRLNLSRQDADIAIRPSYSPHDTLVGQRVAPLGFGIYASRSIAETLPKRPSLEDLRRQRWIGLGEALNRSPSQQWMIDHVPEDQIWLCVDTFNAMAICAADCDCLAILPSLTGNGAKHLRRIEFDGFELSTWVWVLTHPEIKNAARIRAFMDFITKALRQDRHLLAGSEAA